MVMDVSGISYALPVFTFVLVFVILFAVLKKTQILGGNAAIDVIVSIIIAVIFLSLTDVRTFVEDIVPWFVVVSLLAMFFLFFIMFVVVKEPEKLLKPWTAFLFIIILAVIVLYIFYNHFDVGTNSSFIDLKHWLVHYKGSVWLAIVGIIVAWIVVKAK
jgi:hypothetical protein